MAQFPAEPEMAASQMPASTFNPRIINILNRLRAYRPTESWSIQFIDELLNRDPQTFLDGPDLSSLFDLGIITQEEYENVRY